jgi:hypothetical protein
MRDAVRLDGAKGLIEKCAAQVPVVVRLKRAFSPLVGGQNEPYQQLYLQVLTASTCGDMFMLTVITLERERLMLKRLWKTDAPLTMTGLLMLPALAIAAVGLIVDPRLIMGSPAWLKPAKFALSIAVYVFTLAWMFTFIPGFKRTCRVVGWVTAIVMVLELSIISLQAWRGTTSHFNFSTPLNAALFAVMGTAIVLQTVTSIAVAIALWRQEFEDRPWAGPCASP